MKLIYCVVLAIVFLCGCDDRPISKKSSGRVKLHEEKDLSYYTSISIVEFDGHTYIVLHGNRYGSILHAVSCPCMPAAPAGKGGLK